MSNISATALLEAFPTALGGTENIFALAAIASRMIGENITLLPGLDFYGAIDRLPEKLLDLLAYDFKVDWWDPDADVEAKRRTLKNAWIVHRALGTPAAVETAARDVYPDIRLSEWFSYGGQPYHYKIDVDLGEELMDDEKFRRVMDHAKFYVNLRSVMDTVAFTAARQKQVYVGIAAEGVEKRAFEVPGLKGGTL